MSKPPNTSNKKAAALIKVAQSKCAACRVNWRLEKDTFRHSLGRGKSFECRAQPERQQLRDIAAAGRRK